MSRNIATACIAAVSASFGAAATIFTGAFDYFNRDRELDIQMMQIGLSIMRGEGTGNKESIPARTYAISLLEEYGNVTLDKQIKKTWAEDGTTPFKTTSLEEKALSKRELNLRNNLKKLREDVVSRCRAKPRRTYLEWHEEIEKDISDKDIPILDLRNVEKLKKHLSKFTSNEEVERCLTSLILHDAAIDALEGDLSNDTPPIVFE